MDVRETTHPIEQTVPASRIVGRAALVAASAAIIVLAMWSPTSAEVAEGEHAPRTAVFADVVMAGDRGDSVRAKEADQRARDYGQWLRAAHGRTAAAEEAPLPAQF